MNPHRSGRNKAVLDHIVSEEDCVTRGAFSILSTPAVLRLMEEAAMLALDDALEPGESSVGSSVRLTHHRPSLKGQTVVVTADLVESDRRRRMFEIVVEDEIEVIATAMHDRFIIDEAPFGAALHEKDPAG